MAQHGGHPDRPPFAARAARHRRSASLRPVDSRDGLERGDPPIGGLDSPGSFVLREAGDAMQIRAYAQQHGCRRAVVAGGGLLGLEAAYSLHLLGLRVTVLERGKRLLSRQIDPTCSELVAEHFAKAGIEILRRAETSHVIGRPAVTGVVLKDGRTVQCDVFLAATGIRPNVGLARDAGVPVGKGVLVDDRMQTRVPGVFAAGDVAEHRGQVLGLWPVATEQAQAAAVNALGGACGADLRDARDDLERCWLGTVFDRPCEPRSHDDEVIVVGRPGVPSYRRLVLSEGRAVGATVLGHHPSDLAAAQKAVRDRITVGATAQAALRSGDWSVLGHLVRNARQPARADPRRDRSESAHRPAGSIPARVRLASCRSGSSPWRPGAAMNVPPVVDASRTNTAPRSIVT